MDIKLNHVEDDLADLEITFGPDDSFTVSGYGETGGITLRLPLYAREAAELTRKLAPLAAESQEE